MYIDTSIDHDDSISHPQALVNIVASISDMVYVNMVSIIFKCSWIICLTV